MSNLSFDPEAFQQLHWRCIGPPRGGRVVAACGHPTQRNVFYFGGVAGGVWKTIDGGVYWENISDGYLSSASVGAIAVSQADPNVIYVGMGETAIRGDVSWGDGVYKSTDGGKTWQNVGLQETHHIGQIRIHPQDPDIVYVAALGHAFGPNPERGVFRTTDGGQTWEKVLYVSDRAGAVDLALDVTNPRILYATIWQVHRHFWELVSGGPDSGLWKSTDGGDTWTNISRAKGLPREGILGKMGVTISPANPDRVWAIIEAKEDQAGVYRSDDGGQTWQQLTSNRDLLARPWYYMHIFADPQDPDTVYVNNLRMWKSTDGGVSWAEITTPHGDNHALWIDPQDPQRMINGNDGGACVSFNGGQTWSSIYNQMTAQFYHLDVDNRQPYTVYGTQQDNSSIAVPSASEKGAIPWTDCYPAGTGESGYIAVKPDDPDIVFVGAVGSSPGGGGALQRYDHRTKQIRLVTVWPELYSGWGAKDMVYRFPWTFPIVFSPHGSHGSTTTAQGRESNGTNVLYTCGNHVFRTTDEGSSWEVISPDLTRNDESKLGPSGGPLTLDTSGAEHYCTISAFFESPHEPGVFWAGSDDGLVHVSRDGGQSWQNVTPPELPEWSYVTMLEPSPVDPATVYLSATRYKLDDYRPYLFVTRDYGQSWQRVDSAFPQDEITRVIRVDPEQPRLLFVGTETGIFVSLDEGASWQRMPGNLPVAPVYDMKIKEGDLVVATHGRSFWILDDLTPLRELAAGTVQEPVHLFAPRRTLRRWLHWGVYWGGSQGGRNYRLSFGLLITYFQEEGEEGQELLRLVDSGENPPRGVIVQYLLPEEVPEQLSLTFLDAAGNEIRTFQRRPDQKDDEAEGNSSENDASQSVESKPYAPARPGLNRFVWDMRYPDAEKLPGDPFTEKATTGPFAPPGTYQVRLDVGGESHTATFEIYVDPRTGASQEDMEEQFRLWSQICDKVSQVHRGVKRLRTVRERVKLWAEQAKEAGLDEATRQAILEQADGLVQALTEVEDALVQTKAQTPFDRLRLPVKVNAKLVGLMSVVASADARPTRQSYDVFAKLSEEADEALGRLDAILGQELPAFNQAVLAAGIPPVV